MFRRLMSTLKAAGMLAVLVLAVLLSVETLELVESAAARQMMARAIKLIGIFTAAAVLLVLLAAIGPPRQDDHAR